MNTSKMNYKEIASETRLFITEVSCRTLHNFTRDTLKVKSIGSKAQSLGNCILLQFYKYRKAKQCVNKNLYKAVTFWNLLIIPAQ